MMQIVPQSILLNYVVLITVQLKWAWDYLLYQSFFHPNGAVLPPGYVDDSDVMIYEKDSQESDDECAVCLCKINEGDEVRELRCEHLFHRACLDRWLGYGRMTCPLCRNNLRRSPPPIYAAEMHREIILINFCAAASYSDRCAWWLR